jgi:hypothetical protein
MAEMGQYALGLYPSLIQTPNRGVLRKIKVLTTCSLNPIPNGLNPHVVSMSDFCAYLAWPHFFSRIPRIFLMVSKQLHIRALSKCCEVSSCLASLCFKNRGYLFNRGGI